MGKAGKGIKTREAMRGSMAPDRRTTVAGRMKRVVRRSADNYRKLADNREENRQGSPAEYAENRTRDTLEGAASGTGRRMKSAARSVRERAKEKTFRKEDMPAETAGGIRGEARSISHDRNVAEDPESSDSLHNTATGRRTGDGTARRQPYGIRRNDSVAGTKDSVRRPEGTGREPGRTVGREGRTIRRAERETVRGTAEAAGRGIRMAGQTAGIPANTAAETAKAARKAAASSARAAGQAETMRRRVASAARDGASSVAKTAVKAVGGVAARVRNLPAVLAAGGSTAAAAILLICLVGLLAGSFYGIFFSGEDTGSGKTMREAVREMNGEYLERIDSIKEGTPHDDVEISGSAAVWREVLSVYAVKVAGDADSPMEVMTVDDDRIRILKDIFWDMNSISSRTETRTVTVTEETDDGSGNIVAEEREETRTTLFISVTHRTADETADLYGFSARQKEWLAELLDERNREMWSAVLYGIRGGNTDIVEVALSQVGQVGGEPYWSWYGFESHVDWCACFVSWCANECGYIEDGIIPKFAACSAGVQWFKERGQWIDGNQGPEPGMIIFFDWDDPDGECGPQDGAADHVGIVERVEDGTIFTVEGNAGDSCRQKGYPFGHSEIMGYGLLMY